MAEFRPASAEQKEFLADLLGAGLLIESGVPGVYGRSSEFEDVWQRVDELITRAAAPDGAERLRFPPVVPRSQFEASGYLKSFPHLAGTIFGFEGGEAEALEQEERASRHEDWSELPGDERPGARPGGVLSGLPGDRGPRPAARLAARRSTPAAPTSFATSPRATRRGCRCSTSARWCGSASRRRWPAWRDTWRDRAIELLRGIGLEAEFDVATDPFFGRSGRMLAASQREQALKFEILVPIGGPEPTAVASFNYHQGHFAETYGIEMAGGGEAHTACLGFGLERITLALLRAHGLEAGQWPEDVREGLWQR